MNGNSLAWLLIIIGIVLLVLLLFIRNNDDEDEQSPFDTGVKNTVEPPKNAEPETATRVESVPVDVAPAEVVPDDLKKIEGIGPKISRVLGVAGILTFAQLAETTADRVREILIAEDPRLGRISDPTTWSEQAALAAAGKWNELATLQDELKGGRRV